MNRLFLKTTSFIVSGGNGAGQSSELNKRLGEAREMKTFQIAGNILSRAGGKIFASSMFILLLLIPRAAYGFGSINFGTMDGVPISWTSYGNSAYTVDGSSVLQSNNTNSYSSTLASNVAYGPGAGDLVFSVENACVAGADGGYGWFGWDLAEGAPNPGLCQWCNWPKTGVKASPWGGPVYAAMLYSGVHQTQATMAPTCDGVYRSYKFIVKKSGGGAFIFSGSTLLHFNPDDIGSLSKIFTITTQRGSTGGHNWRNFVGVSNSASAIIVNPGAAEYHMHSGGSAAITATAMISNPGTTVWNIYIINPAGAVVRKYAGIGTFISQAWDGKNEALANQPLGDYKVAIVVWDDLLNPQISNVTVGIVGAPGHTVTPLSPYTSAPTFDVQWSGIDNGLGIAGFNVQYKDITAAGIWQDWMMNTAATTGNFNLGVIEAHQYGFRVQAKDSLGIFDNYDADPGGTTTTMDFTLPASSVSALATHTATANFTVNWSGSDSLSGVKNYDVQFKDGSGGSWTNWKTAFAGASDTFNGTNGHTYYFQSRATDNAGNIELYPGGDGDTNTMVDTSPPTFTITDDANAAWNISDTITVTVADTGSGANVTTYWGYSADATCNATDDANLTNTGLTTTVSAAHTDYVCFRNTDIAGNKGYSAAIGPLKVDLTAPTFGTVTPANTATATHVGGSFDLSATFADTGSGVASCEYYCAGGTGSCNGAWNAGAWTTTCSTTGLACSDGQAITLNMRATDNMGNTGTAISVNRACDTAAPTFNITDDANAAWNISDTITVTVADTGGSGTGTTTYWGYSADATCNASDDANLTNTGLTTTVATTHTDYICFKNTDNVGNTGYSAAIGPLMVDSDAPTVSLADPGPWRQALFVVDVSDSDALSGLALCDYKVESFNGAWVVTQDWAARSTCNASNSQGISVGAGQMCRDEGVNMCRITVRATDNAGNVTTAPAATINIDYTGPTALLNGPVASSWQGAAGFDMDVSDSDATSGLTNCGRMVESYNGGWVTTAPWSMRTCNSATSVSISVGAAADCRDQGADMCRVSTFTTDGAGNQIITAAVPYSIDFTAPTFTITDDADAAWNSSDFITVTVNDTGAGANATTFWGFSADATCDSTDDTALTNTGLTTTVTTAHTDYVCFRNTDNAGNKGYSAAIGPLMVDVAAPTFGTVTPANSATATHVSAAFDFSATFADADSGVAGCEYICAGGDAGACNGVWNAGTGTTTCAITGLTCTDGQTLTLNMRATDNAGNTGAATSVNRTCDAAGPTFSITDDVNAAWNISDTITVTVDDTGGSGTGATTYWGFSADNVCDATDDVNLTNTGLTTTVITTHTDYICFRNTDLVGNVGYSAAIGPLQVDVAGPTFTITDDANAAWNTSDTITVTVADTASGADATTYWGFSADNVCDATDDVNLANTGLTTTVVADHTDYICFRNTDNAGQAGYSAAIGPLMVDATGPTVTYNGPSGEGVWEGSAGFDIDVSDSDSLSGLALCEYQVESFNGAWVVTQAWGARSACNSATSQSITVGAASMCRDQGANLCRITARATDNVGNVTTAAAVTFNIEYAAPSITSVNDGIGADEVYSADAGSISANWMSDDTGGVISSFSYAIGTTSGGTNIADWTDVGLNTSMTRNGLTLTHGQTYYVSVRGLYNSGLYAESVSNGVTIDAQPPTAQFISPVADQIGQTTFDVEWSGSDGIGESGLKQFEVQWKSESGEWTPWNPSPTSDTLRSFTGMDMEGYYFRIIAQDNAGNWSAYPVSPDYNLYITIDTSIPSAPAHVYDGGTSGDDIDFASATNSFSGHWDAVPGAIEYAYYVGSTSGGDDVISRTTTTDTSFATSGLNLSDGAKYYLSVEAKNVVNLWSSKAISDGISVDTTAPTCAVAPLDAWQSQTSFTVQWSGLDITAGIAGYDVQVNDNGGGWSDWKTSETAASGAYPGALGHSYGFRCVAKDNAGNSSTYPVAADASTSVDSTAPIISFVNDGAGADASFSNSADALSANWSGSDGESGLLKYEYAIGTTSGGVNILNWTNVNTDASVTKTGLSLMNATTYYISVRATNNAGLATIMTSNGIVVGLLAPVTSMSQPSSAYSATLSFTVSWSATESNGSGIKNYQVQYKDNSAAWADWTPSPTTDTSRAFTGVNGHTYSFRVRAEDNAGNISAYNSVADASTLVDSTAPAISFVNDGTGADASFSNSADALSANWSASDGESGIQKYEYAIGSAPGGSNIVDWTDNGASVSMTESGLSLANAATYYITVRAYNNATLVTVMTSNGILVDTHSPAISMALPSSVYTDALDFTVSWSATEGFGESGVKNYQVQYKDNNGAWTDWTPSPTTETSRAFTGANGHAYAFRVRAEDNAGNLGAYHDTADASTFVDVTAPEMSFVNDGIGADESLTNSADTLSANWSGSDGESGIQKYEYAIGTTSGGSNVVGWTDNGTSASVTKSGLTLSNATTYYITVRAYNNSGLYADMTSNGILVDTLPPAAQFTAPSSEFIGNTTFTVEWSGADGNGESGLKQFVIQSKEETAAWTDWAASPTTDTSRVFTGTDGKTYYFRIKAQDNAGNWSAYPINPDYQLKAAIDTSKPSAPAHVFDGATDDVDYTSVADSFSGHWDAVPGAIGYSFAIGSSPGEQDVVAWTSATETSFTKTGLGLISGEKYYLSVKAKNIRDLWSAVAVSDGVTVDITAPATPVVTDDGDVTSESSLLNFSLTTSDSESPLTNIKYAIGTAANKTDVRDWTDIGLQTSFTASGLSLTPGARYYILVSATNAAGLTSQTGASNGINHVAGALIAFSYLPLDLSVSVSGESDVSMPVELIIKESGGSKVVYTQLKRSFSLPGGAVIEDPVVSVSLTVQANEEQRLKTSVVIPSRIVAMAMGGVSQADVIIRLNYIGMDSVGNAISTVFQIPVKLKSSDASVPFAVGDIKITAPEPGQEIAGGKASASATISVAGIGSINGEWMLNGKSAGSFTQDISKSGDIILTTELAPVLEGENTVVLRITSPVYRESSSIVFKGTVVAVQTQLTDIWAGPVNISEVNVSYNATTKTYSGSGKAKLPFSSNLFEVPLQNISVSQQGDKNMLVGTVITDIANYQIEKGLVLLNVSAALITPDGIKADGSIKIKGADGVPGIGPLYFYGADFTESGIAGKVKLDSPQNGKIGIFTFSVEGLDFSLKSSGATVKATGYISVDQGLLNLKQKVVIESTPSGGLRFGKP